MNIQKEFDYTLVWGVRAGMYKQVKEEVKLLQKLGWTCKGGLVVSPSATGESSCYQTMARLEED